MKKQLFFLPSVGFVNVGWFSFLTRNETDDVDDDGGISRSIVNELYSIVVIILNAV